MSSRVDASVAMDDLHLRVQIEASQSVDLELPSDAAYSEWWVSLEGHSLDASDTEPVALGGAQAVLCRDARWNARFWGRLDEERQDLEVIGSALSQDSTAADSVLFSNEDVFEGDVLIFDRVWIDPAARGRRLSHRLVDVTARTLAPGAVLALQPMPPGHQTDAAIHALQRHWEAGGFRHYRGGVYVKQAPPLPI